MRTLAITLVALISAFKAFGAEAASLEFTYIPQYGDRTDVYLRGRVSGVDPALHSVAVYIRVGDNWWTKPYAASTTVPIATDLTWVAAIVTGGTDEYAVEIAGFLLPIAVTPPLVVGSTVLPPIHDALASVRATRGPTVRTVTFAGYEWTIKRHDFRYDPGPNLWSDSPENIWVDAQGLHLTIKKRDDQWYCTEAILNRNFGYGTYVIQTAGRLDALDPNMVAGLFTFDPFALPAAYRELDIEFARWQRTTETTNAQYVVQPVSDPWNNPRATRFRVDLTDAETSMTHYIIWTPGTVTFKTYYGDHLQTLNPPAERLAKTWTFGGGPTPGQENVCFNFWLFMGQPPYSGTGAEYVVTGFRYTSATLTPDPIVQFINQPSTITTNLAHYPICCYFDNVDSQSITVNGESVADLFYYGGFRKDMALNRGGNTVEVVVNRTGQSSEYYTRSIIYDPDYSTEDRDLLYAVEPYSPMSTIVIDLNNGYVLGLMPDTAITAVSRTGAYLVDKSGQVYRTSSHQLDGSPLVTGGAECYPMFSHDDQYCYYGKRKARFVTREVLADNLGESIDGRYSSYLASTSTIATALYNLFWLFDLTDDSFTTLTETGGHWATPLWGDSAVDRYARYALFSSYGYASGSVYAQDVRGSTFSLIGLSDYIGQIAFTASGYTALVGSFGNSYYGRGGIYVVDLPTSQILSMYSQFGASSVVLEPHGQVYTTSRFIDHFGDGLVLQGLKYRRGVDVLRLRRDGRLEFQKSYFLAAPAFYRSGNQIQLRLLPRTSVRSWSIYR